MDAAVSQGGLIYPSDEREYRRRIRAWAMYDWANSAFATTILAAVLPIYYSQVAGATLPSAAVATSYWSLGLSISLLVVAVLSPILGTISDIMRGKKQFLSVFVAIGVLATAGLVFVGTGDWVLASALAIVGRIGFNGSITFYDALLPHVAREKDQDRVSTLGYALGYLGGGILLAINAVMIFTLGFAEGARWSFLSVAVWWAVFSIPVFRQVPEPASATEKLAPGETIIAASFKRIRETLRDIRRYRELFKFLIAFLIYNDAIGTIIGLAAIYGAELGFGDIELILALLLVQFVGIPFSIVFGYLPSKETKRRPLYFSIILFNMIALPLVGIVGSRLLPQSTTGMLLQPYETVDEFAGTGVYGPDHEALVFSNDWQTEVVPAAVLGAETDVPYIFSTSDNARMDFTFNGREVMLVHSTGPDHGVWTAFMDDVPLLAEGEAGELVPLTIDAYSPTLRYGVTQTFSAEQPGTHTLSLLPATANPQSTGNVISIAQAEVLLPVSQSSLPTILGAVIATQLVGIAFSYVIGQRIFARMAETLNTKRSILLALMIYSVIAVWGYFVNSTFEFWFLAWTVAVVQGGSQALSRSLYAYMSPASKSGEFFGLFAVMEKFASFLGPLIFALAVLVFGSSRPAIVALIAFFIIGGYLLTRVDVEEGRLVARAEDATVFGGSS